MLNDFFSLLFPQTCAACKKNLYKYEQSICTYCIYHLPKTKFHLNHDNPVAKIFWGRVQIQAASALYEFNKGGKVQQLIHQLKYKGRKDIGLTIGELYGRELIKCSNFNTVDLIIPVPLHNKKIKKRGYNQSQYFAEGLAQTMNIKSNSNILVRLYESGTQTKKTRFSRWKNVETVFHLKEKKNLEGKHVLLVDDVITTGSTLEACAQTLIKIPGIKISVATIAYASN